MRLTYILPRLVIVLSLWAFLRWGLDPLLRYSAVTSLQAVIGAKADIASVHTKLYPPRLVVSHVALANARRPGTNLMEFRELEFRLAGDPLLRRQFVVEEGRLSGVRFKTPRADDGLLEPVPEEEESQEPSWLSEKMSAMGEEWLAKMIEQAKAEVDPNTLETYRLGQDLYSKWDGRFDEMKDRVNLLKPRVRDLKEQFENAKQGDTLQQIEQYVQVAQKAEQLARDAQAMRDEVQGIVPEVRTDFVTLDEARQRDQQMVLHKINLLKPDKRRISEALIGEEMYLQLQQLMTWVQTARDYQAELKQQTRPVRTRGSDVSFPIANPAPDFHLARLLVDGEFSIDREPVPFEAIVTDITEDAPLLGRPCVVRVKTGGKTPILLQLTYDARTDEPITSLLAEYSDVEGREISTGNPEKAFIAARLADIRWNLDLHLIGNELKGQVDLQSRLLNPSFMCNDDIRPEFLMAANQALSNIQNVTACVRIQGPLGRPEIDLESDLGEQVAAGVDLAVRQQIQNAKQRVAAEVNDWATQQVATLTSRFGDEFSKLKAEHDALLSQIQGVQSVVASLQSGKINPTDVFRQVKDSRLLSDKQQQQVDRTMTDVNKVLQGGQLPLKTGSLPIPQGINGLPKLNVFPSQSGSQRDSATENQSPTQKDLPTLKGFGAGLLRQPQNRVPGTGTRE